MTDLKDRISSILDEVKDLRRDLHAHPELGYEEHRTARKVREFVGEIDGMEVQEGVAGTGLVLTLARKRKGPCVALRADMDALPMQEEGIVPWRSRIDGKMHACGHDGHTAILAGAARILGGLQDELKGPVKCIFQPAEEGGGGARRMCEEGVLEHPRVAAIYGLHNNLPDPDEKIGRILYCPGATMAGTGTFEIEILGKGGHAAFPHRCVDPIYIGSIIVDQLQSLVSRVSDPVVPVVISVTRFHSGTADNITPGKAVLGGTFRALDSVQLEDLQRRIGELCQQVCRTHGAECTMRIERGYPVLVNDAKAEGTFRRILEEIGDAPRLVNCKPNLGGEDFAFYGERIPAFFYFLSACPLDGTSNRVCHHPEYDFNDDLLPDGIRLHVETARRFATIWQD